MFDGFRPDSDVRAVPPDWRFAKVIRVENAPNGAPVISIDGEVLPWYTQGIVVPVPALGQSPTATVTFLADRVEMVNDQPLSPARREDDEPVAHQFD